MPECLAAVAVSRMSGAGLNAAGGSRFCSIAGLQDLTDPRPDAAFMSLRIVSPAEI